MRLTRDEMILVTCLLLALVTGAVVKHYRDRHREAAAMATAETTGSKTAAAAR